VLRCHSIKPTLTFFTLIGTNKGFKALKKRNLHCIKKIVIASLTGHVYRVSHAFFSLSFLSAQSTQGFAMPSR
jgi:hypothetical protein